MDLLKNPLYTLCVMKLHTFKGGIHPQEMKELSNHCAIMPAFPSSKTVTIPVTMGGAPNSSLVKVGDLVAKGQKIASGDKFMNCPVHSSVSGKVKKICNCVVTGNSEVPCIVIEADDSDRTEFMEPLDPFTCEPEAALMRIKDAGMKLMLDFHYSDTWADPTNQWTPAAWTSLTNEELIQKIYDYTKDVLTELVAEGATPDFIQTGNEISYGMLWGPNGTRNYYVHTNSDKNWDRFISLLTQAGKACREVCPDAKIIIHTERTANWSYSKDFYNRLASLDYDIIGLSYYPEWHNNVTTLKSILGSYKREFPNKPVMIVETGYYNNWYPDNATYNFTNIWPASAAGQKAFLTDLVEAVKSQDNVIGLLYWFPEENPYNNRVYEPWYNHGLFNPNNGKATEALFVMKTLNPEVTTINQHEVRTMGEGKIFTIDGRELKSAENLPHGIYIIDGKKIIK